MTINIALVTNDSVVFGCDSVASQRQALIDPFDMEVVKDESGKVKTDKRKNPHVILDLSKMQHPVMNVRSGVTKLFELSGSPPTAAVTTGLGQLHGRSIKSLADEFSGKLRARAKPLVNVEPVAKAFLRFMRKHYELQHESSNVPKEYWNPLEFLVGGFDTANEFPTLFRVKVKEEKVESEFSSGEFGLAWGGQSVGVHRLIRGYDQELVGRIEKEIGQVLDRHHSQLTHETARIIESILNALGAELPQAIDTSLPTRMEISLPWNDTKLSIQYGALPEQDAVDLVGWLVMIESGRQKFVSGIPTVGGRTRVGVLTRSGFTEQQQPEIQHRFVGFPDDV